MGAENRAHSALSHPCVRSSACLGSFPWYLLLTGTEGGCTVTGTATQAHVGLPPCKPPDATIAPSERTRVPRNPRHLGRRKVKLRVLLYRSQGQGRERGWQPAELGAQTEGLTSLGHGSENHAGGVFPHGQVWLCSCVSSYNNLLCVKFYDNNNHIWW